MSYIHSQLTGASGILVINIGATGLAGVNYTDSRAATSGLAGVNYTDTRVAATGLAAVNYTDTRVAATGLASVNYTDTRAAATGLAGVNYTDTRVAASGGAAVAYTDTRVAATGQQAWIVANNNGINTSGSLVSVSGVLDAKIAAAAVGVATLNTLSGVLVIGGTRGISITPSGQTLWLSGNADTLVASGGVLIQRDLDISGVLDAKIAASAAGVSTLNTLSGAMTLGAAGTNIAISTSGSSTIWISGNGIAQATDLVSTGGLLITRDTNISGGLEWRIFLTGTAANTYTDVRVAATGLAGVNYADTRVVATGAAAGMYTDTRVAASGAAAGVYTDTRAAATGLASVNYTDARAAATGLAAVNYADTRVAASGQAGVNYTDVRAAISGQTGTIYTDTRAAATGLAAVNYTDSRVAISGQTGTIYTDARAAATGLAGVNYTDTRVAVTGQAAWLALNGGDRNLSGNMTATGATLYQRDLDISGGLQVQIGGAGGATPIMTVPFLGLGPGSNLGNAFIWISMPSGLNFFAGERVAFSKVDLTSYSSGRLGGFFTSLAAVTNLFLSLGFSTQAHAAIANYTGLGSPRAILTGSNGAYAITPWFDLNSEAKNDVFLALMGSGGNGSNNQQFTSIMAQFR